MHCTARRKFVNKIVYNLSPPRHDVSMRLFNGETWMELSEFRTYQGGFPMVGVNAALTLKQAKNLIAVLAKGRKHVSHVLGINSTALGIISNPWDTALGQPIEGRSIFSTRNDRIVASIEIRTPPPTQPPPQPEQLEPSECPLPSPEEAIQMAVSEIIRAEHPEVDREESDPADFKLAISLEGLNVNRKSAYAFSLRLARLVTWALEFGNTMKLKGEANLKWSTFEEITKHARVGVVVERVVVDSAGEGSDSDNCDDPEPESED